MSDGNKAVIEEFRANDGKVGGHFEKMDLILLNTIGAKSGLLRVTPLVYMPDGARYVIIASDGGAVKHPNWYHNIVAHPEFEVEVGSEKFGVTATVAEEPERTQLYERMAAKYSFFAEYAKKVERVIPVVILSRKA